MLGLFLGSAFFGSIGSADAQTSVAQNVRERLAAAVQKLQSACGQDLGKFCSTVIFCMMAHEDKISMKCDYALYNAARNMDRALDLLEQAADVCWPDIERYCADVPEGSGRIAQCLLSKKTALAHDCQTAMDQIQAAK